MRDALLPEAVRLEDRDCPLGCPRDDDFVLEDGDRLYGLPGRFRVVSCRSCGLLRTNPRPSPDSMSFYYPPHYVPHQQESAGTRSFPAGWKAGMHRRLGLDVRRLPPVPPGRLLEIGCAAGDWLLAMQAQGWSVEGIEFSPVAAETARRRGLQVHTAAVEDLGLPERRFDVLAAWMVLEHLHEPVAALRRLRDWVQPDGWLVGAVPDAGAWERRLFGARWYGWHLPHHLHHYDRHSLARVFAAAGWRLERVRWQRNPNNLLLGLESLAHDRARGLVPVLHWLAHDPAARYLRLLLGLVLGGLRQSGRLEFWARPAGSAT